MNHWRQKVKLDRKRATVTFAGVVNTLRHHLYLRHATVALLLVSWLLFTNHCALGMMQPPAQVTDQAAHCCGGKADPKHTPQDGPRDCCNIKVTTAPGKAEVKFDTFKFQLQDFVLQVLLAPAMQPSPAFPFDHGPPRAVSFAEAVLQHSLLGHAPPITV